MTSRTQAQLNDLRLENIQQLVAAVGTLITCVLLSSVVPNLLLKFVYTDQSKLMAGEVPFALEWGSTLLYGLGIAYGLYAMLSVTWRNRTIRQLKQQLATSLDKPEFSAVELAEQEAELKELEKMVDTALKTETTKTSSTKKKSSSKSKK